MFIFLSSDGFQTTINRLGAFGEEDVYDRRPKISSVRRPYRGIQIKEDTYSTLSVREPSGRAIPLTSSSDRTPPAAWSKPGRTGQVSDYADYILQSVQEQRVEKQQIIETFGDPFVFFFGERPRILQVSGLLINTADFNWRSQFWKNYEERLRGTKLVQQNARAYLSFDTIIVEGYLLNATAMDDSSRPYSIPFNFSMLVTNYYDWSDIGQTLFPNPAGSVNVEVLNEELEKRRTEFVSSGAQVRLRNLLADPGGGLFDAIRGGIKKFNDTISLVGGITDKLHSFIGGRTVRLPIGVAGSLYAAQDVRQQGVGIVTVGQGSIGGSAILSSFGLGQQYDAVTGTFQGIGGSVRLRMPGNALFAPPWISNVTNQPRGYIFENVDEYPNVEQTGLLRDVLRLDQYIDLTLRRLNRVAAAELADARLLKWNLMAESGGLLETLTDGVNFAKDAFGMVMTAKAFIENPADAVRSTLGIGIGNSSKSRISITELEKLGVKRRSQQTRFTVDENRYIGEAAAQSFKEKAEAVSEEQIQASLGEVYAQSSYVPQADRLDELATYEEVYGSNDYTPLIKRAEEVAAEEALTGEQSPSVRTTEDIQRVLQEVFGDVDTPPGGIPDLDPDVFDAVYGTGSSSRWVRTPEEIARALQQALGIDVEADEDTEGIIGVDDDGAQIDPIV